jgi:hypothetical protein
MANINLLSTDNAPSSASVTRRLARLIAQLLALVLLAVFAYYGYLQYSARTTAKELQEVKEKTAQAQRDALGNKDRLELITRQGQLQSLDKLIKAHVSWSYLLPELARVSLRTASYTSVEAAAGGKMILTATLPDYKEVDKFLQIFDLPEYNEQFSDVKVMSVTKAQQGANLVTQLKIQLTFNPEFIKNRFQTINAQSSSAVPATTTPIINP